MRRGCAAIALAMAMAGCGMAEQGATPQFKLESGDFADGGAIPRDFTCDGMGIRPALRWSEPPAGTKSLALIVDDPDAPGGTFGHWGMFDIPPAVRFIGGQGVAGRQAKNDFGSPGYGGPCPPPGHGPHHYRFKLLALDVERLDVRGGAGVKDVEKAALKHLVGRAELTGIYERK